MAHRNHQAAVQMLVEDAVRVSPIVRDCSQIHRRATWLAVGAGLAQQCLAGVVQIIEGVPEPDDLPVGVEYYDHIPENVDRAGGYALHRSENGGIAVRQNNGFVVNRRNGVRAHGEKLLRNPAGICLPDSVTGQVNKSQNLRQRLTRV